MLVTKTDGASCRERKAMLRLRSINPPSPSSFTTAAAAASDSTRSSVGRRRKSSKLLRNGYSLRLTYPGWMVGPGLHATNYLRRDPPTNSLTFHHRHHRFSLFHLSARFLAQCSIFCGFKRKKGSRETFYYRLHSLRIEKKLSSCLKQFTLYCVNFLFISFLSFNCTEYIFRSKVRKALLISEIDECLMFPAKLHETVLMAAASAFVTKFETTIPVYQK